MGCDACWQSQIYPWHGSCLPILCKIFFLFLKHLCFVCFFQIDIAETSPYTGIFKPGKVTGIVRVGSGLDLEEANAIMPGASLKFLRSHSVSANVHTLFAIGGLSNFAFFSIPLSNFIPVPDEDSLKFKMIQARFCQSGRCITKNGISNLASIDQDGNKAETPKVPFELSLEPTEEVQFSPEKPDDNQAFMKRFTDIPVGSMLYKLRVYASPEDDEGMILGNLVTIDKCVTSHFGDTRLFFKHQGIDEDAAVNPQWSDAYYKDCVCNVPEPES